MNVGIIVVAVCCCALLMMSFVAAFVLGSAFALALIYSKVPDIVSFAFNLYFLGYHEWLPNFDGLDQGTFETIDHADGYSLDKWTRKADC